jgi:hypothetical protein
VELLAYTLRGDANTCFTYRITTDNSPCAFRVGFTVISTSCPSAVRNSISRPTEKSPARFRISVETCGWLDAKDFPDLRLREAARLHDLVELQCQAILQALLLLRVGSSRWAKMLPLPSFALVLLVVSSTCSCGANSASNFPSVLIAIIKSSNSDSQL